MSRVPADFASTDAPGCESSSVARRDPGSHRPSLPFAAPRRGDSVRSAGACSAVAAANARTSNNAQETYVPSTASRAWRRRLCRRYVMNNRPFRAGYTCFRNVTLFPYNTEKTVWWRERKFPAARTKFASAQILSCFLTETPLVFRSFFTVRSTQPNFFFPPGSFSTQLFSLYCHTAERIKKFHEKDLQKR